MMEHRKHSKYETYTIQMRVDGEYLFKLYRLNSCSSDRDDFTQFIARWLTVL